MRGVLDHSTHCQVDYSSNGSVRADRPALKTLAGIPRLSTSNSRVRIIELSTPKHPAHTVSISNDRYVCWDLRTTWLSKEERERSLKE